MRISRPLAALLAGLTLVASNALAAEHQFPYEATVQTNEVEVRSGPGQRYYVTGRVKLNDKVTVHRHDPGGWFMVAPPAGSFSWIEASLVRPTEGNRGVVEASQIGEGPSIHAIVRIGSEFSDEHSFYGRELATGDEVTILGEKTLNTDRGAIRMYKIVPPALEYRWVKGDYIVAASGGGTAAAWTPPTNTIRDSAVAPAGFQTESGPAVTALPRTVASTIPAAQATSSSLAPGSRSRLAEIDRRYLEMIQQPVEQWSLDSLISDYEGLRSSDPATAAQVEQRLSVLAARKKISTEWQEFLSLTTSTSQRDAELVALGGGPVAGTIGGPQPTTILQAGAQIVVQPQAGPTGPAPEAAPQTPQPGVPGAEESQPGLPVQPAVTPRLDGAGIVQRMPTGRRGWFTYVLTDRSGRVLAELRPGEGMNLESSVGQPLGVVGSRSKGPQGQADVIDVRQVLPVQLTP